MIRTRCYKIFHLEMNINWQLQLLYMHLFTLNTKHLFCLPNQQSMLCQNDHDFYTHIKVQKFRGWKHFEMVDMTRWKKEKRKRRQLFSSNSSIMQNVWINSEIPQIMITKSNIKTYLYRCHQSYISQSWLAIEIKQIYDYNTLVLYNSTDKMTCAILNPEGHRSCLFH